MLTGPLWSTALFAAKASLWSYHPAKVCWVAFLFLTEGNCQLGRERNFAGIRHQICYLGPFHLIFEVWVDLLGVPLAIQPSFHYFFLVYQNTAFFTIIWWLRPWKPYMDPLDHLNDNSQNVLKIELVWNNILQILQKNLSTTPNCQKHRNYQALL